ncbi:MAG: glycosyltransferase, partial [Pseudolabrys sp.]|nr:glycosyltransferase [Pseudolabrys sp.]
IDVLVLASRHEEGFGLVLAEAGERGLPVVATRSGGAAEVVRDGETGFLVGKHAPHELAAAMQRLYSDAGLRECLGRRGRDRVAAGFDLAAQTARMADCFAEVAAGRLR